MKFIGIIPARYASTRFPGKPLVDIFGKSMIRRVYENSLSAFDYVTVATDDVRIKDAVHAFGGNVIMTSVQHRSGTDRCAEAARIIRDSGLAIFDIVINIQGDEPFLDQEQLQLIMSCFHDHKTQIATLIRPINNLEDLFSPNLPKVVVNSEKEAMYFSRAPIPYLRNAESNDWLELHTYYGHIGMYAFRADILDEISKLNPSSLEKAESLEQLRWIENGYRIKTALSLNENIAIDTPDDLKKLIASKKGLL
ncbi:MAG: 3-deoxy-manno-octulosonate cytidylyltransferase [Bacteroidia bacterium]|nr:3-deoxy-manno-octulosonate cytidylyltransferase [Bacteroidia bacterium]